jgi:predicted metal-dependent phosphoesterase TrpH
MSSAGPTDVDLHVKVLDEGVVERAKRRGLDALVYAPHFTRLSAIRDRAERFSDDDLTVVPAREVFTGDWRHRRHVLALGLEEPVPDFITLAGAFEEFARQDAVVLVPHPEFLTVSLSAAEIRARRDRIDAVEAYNAKAPGRMSREFAAVAGETDLPTFGSSYAHLRGTVGEAWTRFEGDLDGEADLLTALRTGAPRRVMRRSGGAHYLRGAVEFAHLGYENSWEKLDRLFLSGTEPTHPRHIAYDGRFDDIAVY